MGELEGGNMMIGRIKCVGGGSSKVGGELKGKKDEVEALEGGYHEVGEARRLGDHGENQEVRLATR